MPTTVRRPLGEIRLPPPWAVRVVGVTGSTNADLARAARAGAAEFTVLAADEQRSGRGRLDRQWTAPPGSALLFSALLRPGPAAPPARWGWLPLLAGVAVVTAVRRDTGLSAALKWPNDVLLDGRKVAGVLAEVVPEAPGAVVVGVGLNVDVEPAELPVPTATSLTAAGVTVERERLLAAVLVELGERYTAWRAAGGDPQGVRAAYREVCATLGAAVQVTLPGQRVLRGVAVDVDAEGRLVVDAAGGPVAVAAGEVVHVRPDTGCGA